MVFITIFANCDGDLSSLGVTLDGLGRSQFEPGYALDGCQQCIEALFIKFLKHEDDLPFTNVIGTLDTGRVTRTAQAANRKHSQIQVVVVQVHPEPGNVRERVMGIMALRSVVTAWVARSRLVFSASL